MKAEFIDRMGDDLRVVNAARVSFNKESTVPDAWRKRAENVKQGSSEETIENLQVLAICDAYEKLILHAESLYQNMIEAGVCLEQARMVLPQSMMTSYYVTGSLAAWARAYKQRVDFHAQKEIRDLAVQWNKIIEPLFPVSWKALVDG